MDNVLLMKESVFHAQDKKSFSQIYGETAAIGLADRTIQDGGKRWLILAILPAE